MEIRLQPFLSADLQKIKDLFPAHLAGSYHPAYTPVERDQLLQVGFLLTYLHRDQPTAYLFEYEAYSMTVPIDYDFYLPDEYYLNQFRFAPIFQNAWMAFQRDQSLTLLIAEDPHERH